MSKNLTRKGLALGAVVALGSTLIAGSPAFAAPAITIAPAAGTTYNVLSSDVFALKVFGNTELTFATTTDLRWEVKKAADQAVEVYSAANAGGTYTTAVSADADSTTTTAWYDAATVGATAAGQNWFKIDPAANSTSKTVSVDVRAYIELDGTAGLSAGDLTSNSVTVKFLGAADVAATTVVSDFIVGAATQSASVTVPGLNYSQVASGSANIVWYDNGTAQTAAALAANADADALVASYTNPAVAGDIIGAKAQAVNYEGGTATDISAAVYKTAISATTDEIADFGVTKGANVRAFATGDWTTVAGADVAYAVKTATKVVKVSATLKKSSVALGAGVPVTVTVTEDGTSTGTARDTVATGTKISAGGKSFTAAVSATGATAGDLLTYTAFTDAAGLVSAEITSTTGALDDRLKVTFTSNGVSKIAVIGWENNKAAKIAEVGAADGVRSVTKTGAIAVSYQVLDAFGQVWVDSTKTYQIAVATTGSTGATFTAVAPYSGAPVSFNLTNNATANGALTVTGTLQYLDASTPPAYAAIATGAVTTSSVFAVVSAATVPAAVSASTFAADGTTAYTYGTTADAALTLVDYKNVDLRLDTNTVSAPTTAETNVVSGVVTDSVGAAVPGASVTIAGAGVAFSANSGNVHAIGSITVNASATGTYAVKVYSHTAGDVTFTVTSGAVSKTAKIKFAAAGAATATKVAITAPANILPGQFAAIKLRATDKYGNPVNTAVTSVGVADTTTSVKLTVAGGSGYFASTPLTETDADGYVSGVWMTSAADTGNLTVTAAYDHATAANDLSVTQTVAVAAAAPAASTKAGAVIATKNGRVYVTVNNAAGFRSSVKVGFSTKPSFRAASGSQLVSYFVGAGKRVAVVVSVRGGIVASQAITVK